MINTTEDKLALDGLTEIVLFGQSTNCIKQGSPKKRQSKLTDPIVYSIFTSGSTGEPKGVQISSEAVQSFTRWMSSDFGFTPQDVLINSAVLSFDLSVFEVMTFAALGATLLLNDKATNSDPELLLNRIKQYKGSIWVATPSFMMIFARMKEESRMAGVKSFLFCGEILPNDLAQKLISNYPEAKVFNTYDQRKRP